MSMPMMQIGIVRVPVHQADVPVPMRMRLAGRIGQAVLVLVMLVVMMPVLVPHWFMVMFVLVPLGQVQPEAETHHAAGDEELHG
jgi:hypothetical protein